MRRRLTFALVMLLAPVPLRSQESLHEYRPEIIVTLPRWHGLAVTLLEELHLATHDLSRTEQLQGVGLVSPTLAGGSAAVELRQVRRASGAIERRWIPTLNVRTTLGPFDLRDRARLELRDVDGVWSRRYQNRVYLGRRFHGLRRELDPYAYHDLSYDTRFHVLNRREGGVGVRIPLVHGVSVDPFLMRQTDTRRTPDALVALGLIVRVAL